MHHPFVFRRAAAAGLALSLMAGLLAGCGTAASPTSEAAPPVNTGPEPKQTDTLTLAYSKEQGFNPYLTDSNLTLQCAQLLFEPLVELTDSFEVEYRLARSVTSSGGVVTIAVGQGTFADGTTVTGADVAASLEAARQSALYGSRFAQVSGVAADGNTVTVTLTEPDSLFVYLLDIPVLKAAETASAAPTASGRYTTAQDDAGVYLAARESFAGQTIFSQIRLTDVGAYDAIISGLSAGTIDLYASELDADLAGSNSCNTVSYNLNNLVFLGVNSQSGPLAQPGLRQAVSAAVSRRQIADRAYYSRAYVATTLANSRYPFLTGEHTFNAETDAEGAASALAALGYTRDDMTGFYKDAQNQPLTLELLCYSGSTFKRYAATLVKEQLESCGIQVTVVEEGDFAAYHEKVVSGQFALYIGEVKLYNNINLAPFFSATGDASGGVTVSETLLAAYNAMRADVANEWAFEQAFAAELPFIPLVYKNGVLSANRRLDGLSPTISDSFYQLEQVTSQTTAQAPQ